MSEAVWLAIIAMASKGWTDTVAFLVSPTGMSAVGFLIVIGKQWVDGRKANQAVAAAQGAAFAAGMAAKAAEGAHEVATKARIELTEKIDANTLLTVSVRDVAVRSEHEITNAFQAGERSGYVRGIPEGRKQASGPAPLE